MVTKDLVEKMIRAKEDEILDTWIKSQLIDPVRKKEFLSDKKLRDDSSKFLREFIEAINTGEFKDLNLPIFKTIKEFLSRLSRERGSLGFTPTETATYIFSLKTTLLPILREVYGSDLERLVNEINKINDLIDKLGMYTFEEYVKTRETVIKDQAVSLIELSSPIVTIWEKVLTVPIIGILDSNRTQTIMENLLSRIVETGSKIAIIDITGVGVIDTQVANHLLKTVSAVKLLGADAIITGIRPEVAQTIVQLGIEIGSVITRATLADGLNYAFKSLNLKIIKG